tara:strand:+ start:1150 stop:1722 length:573 start_codon:yes stop_codon:yes gene_type:complete
MFIIKKQYFLIIESIKEIDLKNIKIKNKFSIIYRNLKTVDKLEDLSKFRKVCKLKSIKFFVANNYKLAINLKSDGIYLSSHNRSLKPLSFKRSNFKVIGSAHNFREISMKINQGCNHILFSKLFLVEYDKLSPFLGVIKFNNFLKLYKSLIPLGGINLNNLSHLKNINSKGFAVLSAIKKKPANIINRLF